MKLNRRSFLAVATSALTAAGAATLWPLRALADWVRPEQAFQAKSLQDALAALGGPAEQASGIAFQTPEIAENGAVVPVSVKSSIPGTEQIAILVEVNPTPLAALFSFADGAEPTINTRVKVSKTGRLYAAVKAQGKLYVVSRETKVTLGGCGG